MVIDAYTASGIIGLVLSVGCLLAWVLSNGDEDDE